MLPLKRNHFGFVFKDGIRIRMTTSYSGRWLGQRWLLACHCHCIHWLGQCWLLAYHIPPQPPTPPLPHPTHPATLAFIHPSTHPSSLCSATRESRHQCANYVLVLALNGMNQIICGNARQHWQPSGTQKRMKNYQHSKLPPPSKQMGLFFS